MKKLLSATLVICFMFNSHVNASNIDPDMVKKAYNKDCSYFIDGVISHLESENDKISVIANDDPSLILKQGNGILCRIGITTNRGDAVVLYIHHFHRNVYMMTLGPENLSNMREFRSLLRKGLEDERAAGIDGDKVISNTK